MINAKEAKEIAMKQIDSECAKVLLEKIDEQIRLASENGYMYLVVPMRENRSLRNAVCERMAEYGYKCVVEFDYIRLMWS